MIFTHFKDSLLGYFDNLRSDSYFNNIDVSKVSSYRMASWSHRNFKLINLSNLSKAQAKALSADRVKRTTQDYNQWKQLAGKLSKNQIVQLKYDDISSHFFSLNKIYKLFINKTIGEKYIYDRLLAEIKDPERRAAVMTRGLDYNFVVNSSEAYLGILKQKPLYQSIYLIRLMSVDQVTPEIANEIVSRLTETDIVYLRYLNLEVVDKIWSVSTHHLSAEQHQSIENYVLNSGDLTWIYYIPINCLNNPPIVGKIKAALQNNPNFQFETLSPASAFVLFECLPEQIAHSISEKQLAYLIMNNAKGVRVHLKNRYYEFLTRNQNEFVKVWDLYPELHNEIIKNMVFDPKLVIHNISPSNLSLLATRHPELHQEHKDRLSGKALIDFVHNYPGRLDELSLTSNQVIEFLKLGNSRQAEMFLAYFAKFGKELVAFDQQLKFIDLLPEPYLDRLAGHPGIRERLSDNWDGENPAHVCLGTIFVFNPKDFLSSKWYLFCHKMQNSHFHAWIHTKPRLTVDQVVSAYSNLQHLKSEKFTQRARKIWDCEHNKLNKLIKSKDVNIRSLFFSYAFPLNNWTPEILNQFKPNFIDNLKYSIKYELDSRDDIIKATSLKKDDAICFLVELCVHIKRSKLVDACLPEWNQWVVSDYQKRIEDPGTDIPILNKRIEYLALNRFLTPESRAEIDAIRNKHEKDKAEKIVESAEYKALLSLLNNDLKAINEASTHVSKEHALDKFTANYKKLKELTGDIKIENRELDDIRKTVKTLRIELHKEEEFWGFFARLYTLNKDLGIDPVVKERNKAILNKAHLAGYSEIGDFEFKNDVIDPTLVAIQVNSQAVQVPVIARDEIGTVDYEETLKRIALLVP